MNTKVSFSLLVCVLSISQCYGYYATGDCISAPTIKDFDAKRYSGSWYEFERAGVVFEYILKCVVAEYGYINATSVTVLNTGLSIIGNKRFNVTGTAYSKSLEEPNKLNVDFDKGNVGDYNVWETDYDTYALVYSCKPVIEFAGIKIKKENTWILSRSLNLDQDLVSRLKSTLKENNINPEKLSVVDQSC